MAGKGLTGRHAGRRLHSALDGERRTDGLGVAAAAVADGASRRSDGKLGPDGLFDFEPGVAANRLDLGPLDEVVGEHGENHILALLRYAGEILPGKGEALLLPEDLAVLVLFVEGHRSGDEDVEDDADGPHVGFGRTVLLAGENFRRRVGLGPAERGAGIDDIHFGETEIANLYVELVVDQHVLEFQVAMGDA